jgi:hypothetical protein
VTQLVYGFDGVTVLGKLVTEEINGKVYTRVIPFKDDWVQPELPFDCD